MSKKGGFVSIILLNYNGKQFNKDCIDSILKQTYKNYEIVFVNNMSNDGSLEEIEHYYENEIKSGIIKILKPKNNLRFAGGNNFGVINSSKEAEYIWILNNDTYFDENCLLELVEGIENNKELGGISSVIMDKGKEAETKKMIDKGYVWMMNPFGGLVFGKAKKENGIFYTNFLSGCSFLYKKHIIDLPFFDFYKIYAEDLQFSREILLKGYKLGVCENSIIHHLGSATMKKIPYTKIYLDTRNLLINYVSFFSHSSKIKLFIPYVFNFLLKIALNRGNFLTYIKAYWNSFFEIMKSDYVKIVRERINNGRKISDKEFLLNMPSKLINDAANHKSIKQIIVNIINNMNKIYFRIFNIGNQ